MKIKTTFNFGSLNATLMHLLTFYVIFYLGQISSHPRLFVRKGSPGIFCLFSFRGLGLEHEHPNTEFYRILLMPPAGLEMLLLGVLEVLKL